MRIGWYRQGLPETKSLGAVYQSDATTPRAETAEGDMPEKGRHLWTAGGIGHEGAGGITGHLGGGIFNIRSIPSGTSTGRAYRQAGMSRISPQRGYGASLRHSPSTGLNHSRPRLTIPRPPAPFIPETVEPLLDVFDEGDQVVVVADVPGAEDASITVEIENHALKLRAVGKYRIYTAELGLPAEKKLSSPVWTLNNGIIEIRLEPRKGKAKSHR